MEKIIETGKFELLEVLPVKNSGSKLVPKNIGDYKYLIMFYSTDRDSISIPFEINKEVTPSNINIVYFLLYYLILNPISCSVERQIYKTANIINDCDDFCFGSQRFHYNDVVCIFNQVVGRVKELGVLNTNLPAFKF